MRKVHILATLALAVGAETPGSAQTNTGEIAGIVARDAARHPAELLNR